MSQAAEPLSVTKQDRKLMDEFLRGGSTLQISDHDRSGAPLRGFPNAQLARTLETTKSSVLKCRARYQYCGVSCKT